MIYLIKEIIYGYYDDIDVETAVLRHDGKRINLEELENEWRGVKRIPSYSSYKIAGFVQWLIDNKGFSREEIVEHAL